MVSLKLAVSFHTRFTYPERDSALVGKGTFSLLLKSRQSNREKDHSPTCSLPKGFKASIVVRHQQRCHKRNEVVQPVSGRTRHWKQRGEGIKRKKSK